MREALRHIAHTARRFKSSTILNLTGLVVSFAACYLLLTQVAFLGCYNHGIKDHERIYRFESTIFDNDNNKWGSAVTRFMAEDIGRMPQVEGVTMVNYGWRKGSMKLKQGEREFDYLFCPSNNTAVSNLTSEALDGDIEWNDNDREGIIIPGSIAKQYFGTTQAAGRPMLRVTPSGTDTLTVRGVYRDFPGNCIARNNIMVNVGDLYADTTGKLCFICLVKFKPGVKDVNSLIKPLVAQFKASTQRFLAGKNDEELKYWHETLDAVKFQFRPLDETNFSNTDENDTGSRNTLHFMSLIVALIILIAIINSLNFTLALSPMWVRGANIRLVLGASRRSIRLRVIYESLIFSLAAFLLTLAFVGGLSMVPTICRLFDGNIALSAHPYLVLALLGITLAVGISSGIYPAFYTTSFSLATALKGTFGLTPSGRKMRLRLVGVQLVISMTMMAFICTLYQHSLFIFQSDYGYDIKQILHIELTAKDSDYRDALRHDLLQVPGVQDVSYSRFVLSSLDHYITNSMTDPSNPGREFTFIYYPVDNHYLATMGINLVEGRNFKPSDAPGQCYIINKAMMEQCKKMGLDKSLASEGIVGVCENIRHTTTRTDNQTAPIALVYMPPEYPCWLANVRIDPKADREAIKSSIARLARKHSGHQPPPVADMTATIDKSYASEFRFTQLVYLFSCIGIIITLVGVFCLMMFETQYRRKEIGIRKVTGATSSQIIAMLCRQYCTIIVICFFIAVPLAYFIGIQWLNSFAEHQPIGWWQFPLSLLVVGGLTLATVLMQCWHTAHENPTDSVKAE